MMNQFSQEPQSESNSNPSSAGLLQNSEENSEFNDRLPKANNLDLKPESKSSLQTPTSTTLMDGNRGALQGQIQGRRWGLSTKLLLGAIAFSAAPLLLVGSILYWHPENKRSASDITPESVQQERQNLGLVVGLGGIVMGTIAALLTRRTTQSVVRAASTSNNLVNRLRQEAITLSDRVQGKDELIALESNLQLLSQQLPALLSTEAVEAEKLKVLMDITRLLREARSGEDLLRMVVAEVRQRFRTERVTIFKLNENGEGVFIEESVAQGWPKLLWSTVHDPCFAEGYLPQYQEGRVRAIDNIYEANLGDCHVGLLERFRVKANLVAPIVRDNQLFGLLIAHQCSASRFWQSTEIDLFAQIAVQIGFSLDHVRLLEEVDDRATQAQLFIDIARRIRTSLNTEEVLKTTVNEVRKAINADRVIVYSFDEQWYGTVVAEAVLPGYPKALWAKIKDPCFEEGYVEQYQSGRVQATDNILDAGLTPCHLQQLEPFAVKANLVAPILKDNQLFGLLIAHQCAAPRQWQPSEIDWFAQIATQVGFAIDHARLLEQINTESIQSKVLANITRQIRASLIEDDVLKTTVTEVRRAFQTDRVIVYSFDEEWYGTVVAEAVLPGYPKALWAKIKDPCFIEGYVDKYREGRVQATRNVELAGLTSCHLKQLEPFAVRANLVAPILKEDKLFGLLITHQCSGPRDWTSTEVDLFAQIAIQVGFALEHARLLDQVEQAYQGAELASGDQRHLHESLRQGVFDWLHQSEPVVKALSEETLKQMEGITTLYQHLKTFSTEIQSISTLLLQQETQGQQAQQVLQKSQDLSQSLQQRLSRSSTEMVSATQQVQALSKPTQKLAEITQLIYQITSQMKLQAMNAALEATRMGDSNQAFAGIGEKVLDLARQLEGKTVDLSTVAETIQSQMLETVNTLQSETRHIQSGFQLGTEAEAALAQVVAANTQLQTWMQSIVASTQRQADSSATVNQMILEVATHANQVSEQAIAIAGTLEQLHVLSHRETPA
jgi:methyl-accepting chemotaxis protein PixJ